MGKADREDNIGLHNTMELAQEILGGKRTFSGTFLFADVRGFTEMTSSIGPADSLDLMSRFYEIVSKAVIAHGGIVDNHIGDAVLVHFGISDDKLRQIERAVETAVEIQSLTAAEGLLAEQQGRAVFSVGIGISTGEVAVGTLGAEYHNRSFCIGEPVNIASRLTSIANPGQILVCENVVERAKEKGRFSLFLSVVLRGLQGPVKIYEAQAGDGIYAPQREAL